MKKQIIGEPLVINGRQLSLSRAVRAGDMIYLTGQIPMRDGKPMTDGSIEEQTRSCIESIQATLKLADCDLSNIVKTTVWLRDREDFAGFDATYGEYFGSEPPGDRRYLGRNSSGDGQRCRPCGDRSASCIHRGCLEYDVGN